MASSAWSVFGVRIAEFDYDMIDLGSRKLGKPACPARGSPFADGCLTFAAYRAFEKMPEVANAAAVTVESLETFLKAEEKAIQALLAGSILELRAQYGLPLSVTTQREVDAIVATHRGR